jgi:hypothetical protein
MGRRSIIDDRQHGLEAGWKPVAQGPPLVCRQALPAAMILPYDLKLQCLIR